MSKWKLMQAFMSRQPITVIGKAATAEGVIEALEHEDGSGSSFNVRVRRPSGSVNTVYVRTVD